MVWWVVNVRGKYLGNLHATEAEMRNALGAYIRVEGNAVNVYGPPR